MNKSLPLIENKKANAAFANTRDLIYQCFVVLDTMQTIEQPAATENTLRENEISH